MENENNPSQLWDCGECDIELSGDAIFATNIHTGAGYFCSLNHTSISMRRKVMGEEYPRFNYYEMRIKILKIEDED